MINIIIGFALGMAFYHIMLRKILNKKEPSKLQRILDIVKEDKTKKEEKEENYIFKRVK